MRRTIIPVLILFLSIKISAQEKTISKKKVEFRAGLGLLSLPTYIESISSAAASSIISPDYSSVDLTGSVNYVVSVLLAPDNRVNFGMDFIYDKIKATYLYPGSSDVKVKTNYISLMPRVDLKYINKPSFNLYGSLAAGVSFRESENQSSSTESTDTSAGWAFHVAPLGIRVGNAVAFWAEAGFGYRGTLAGGISFKL